MIYVPHIERELILPCDAVATVYLRPPGNARDYVVAMPLPGAVQGKILHEEWPRADKTHLTESDIEQLREFIQRCFSHERAERCEPLFVAEKLPAGIALVVHSPEFDYTKDLLTITNPWLREEGIASLGYDEG